MSRRKTISPSLDQDITFAVDKDLFEKAKPIRVDFVEAVGDRFSTFIEFA